MWNEPRDLQIFPVSIGSQTKTGKNIHLPCEASAWGSKHDFIIFYMDVHDGAFSSP